MDSNNPGAKQMNTNGADDGEFHPGDFEYIESPEKEVAPSAETLRVIAAAKAMERAEGHKISYARSGANNNYWTAVCTCGWHSRVWTERKGVARLAARCHMSEFSSDEPRRS